MHEPLPLVKRLLAANYTSNLLQALRAQAMCIIAGDFSLINGLLLY
jgi:hypothetical protein